MGKALQSLGYDHRVKNEDWESPPEGMGDCTFPCWRLGPHPERIAGELVDVLSSSTGDLIARWEARGPYVNCFADWARMGASTLLAILRERERYGHGAPKGVRTIVEHTSANPNGPLHVGNARNPVIGDSLARILKASGYEVETEYYVNDMGKQVAVMVWGMGHLPPEEGEEKKKEDHVLVRYYQRASGAAVEEEVGALLAQYEAGKEPTVKRIHKACERVLSGIQQSLTSINVSIDRYQWESELVRGGTVSAVIDRLKKTPYYREEGGATFLTMEGEKEKLFLTRKDGTTLYTTRDIAYHLNKFERADDVIDVLGEDHRLESEQLAAVLKGLGYPQPRVVFYSFVTLPAGEGKMSTRRGRVVYLDDLVGETIQRAYREVDKRRPDLPEEKKRRIAELVGVGALRYNIVKVQPEKSIVFRWDEALDFKGASAPFIQYAHARACGILRKGGWSMDRVSEEQIALYCKALNDERERAVIRALSRFPTIVRASASNLRPDTVAEYAYDLAAVLNKFYQSLPVLRGEPGVREARLALVSTTRQVLSNALDLLGITAPEEM